MPAKRFVTGFPGFIAKRLVDRLIRKDPEARFTFLVEARMRDAARQAVAELAEQHPGFADRATLVAGDITATYLGMGSDQYAAEAADTTQVWHLAAIYNLAVPAAVAYRINVVGTANVLDFCETCPKLERLDYISTCYVSGLRTGTVLEAELDQDQGFKNHYESTKCWAEIEVRRRMHRMPVAIHRPGIVVGDSRTGETDKYDGPYYLMRLLNKLPRWMPMVGIGEGRTTINLVPVDFLVDAMASLGLNPQALGKTIQLADPRPHQIGEVLEHMMVAFGFRKPLTTIAPNLVERALDVDQVRNLMQIPREALVYFTHDASYDTANQVALLEGTGLRCPDFLDVIPTLVDYVKRHPDKPFLDGRSF